MYSDKPWNTNRASPWDEQCVDFEAAFIISVHASPEPMTKKLKSEASQCEITVSGSGSIK